MIINLSERRIEKTKEKYSQKAIDSNEKFILSNEKNPLHFIPPEAFNNISDIREYNYLKNGLLISKHLSTLDDVLTNICWKDNEHCIEKTNMYEIIKNEQESLKKDLGISFFAAQTHCNLSGGFMMSFPEYICALTWLKSNRDKESNQKLEDSLTIEGVEWLNSIISIEKPEISLLKTFPSYIMISHPENYESEKDFGIKMDVKIKTEKDFRKNACIKEITFENLKVTNSLFKHGACNYFNSNYELSAICRGSYNAHYSHFRDGKHTNIQNIPTTTIKYKSSLFIEDQEPSVRICYKIK